MRLSAEMNDPGYAPECGLAKILVDGKQLKNVVTADEEAGVAMVYRVRRDGQFIRYGDVFAMKTVRGKIEIRFRAGPSWLARKYPGRVDAE